MRVKISIVAVFLCISLAELLAQSIPINRVLSSKELKSVLKEDVQRDLTGATNASMASYFREKFKERYFFDYQRFSDRLNQYNQLYKKQDIHESRAFDHMNKFNDSTQWKLPFNYKNGQPVNAYALRHLARQHKMVDIAFQYDNSGNDTSYIEYFTNQMSSLNNALLLNQYETIPDGNGVYEAFRAGYRVLNWLWIHNMFLGEQAYTDDDQLTTIATLLQHGQHLYANNDQFRSGNHQTRGVSALAMLSILLRDFEGTDQWFERAMLRLSEHLEREINEDGFQFERSVHYHMSDINNYFYVYQLAKINKVAIDPAWEEKLRGLFTTLVKIAYPDRSAPVLQDDTEIPWAERNEISGTMTLGYLLFEDPEFGYFASNKVDDKVYWFLTDRQLGILNNIQAKKPKYGSLAFEETGYFIMREGWEEGDKMMIISAGLDDKKPDHQHGDMLGVQAIANGHAILPNYQVRYSLEDYEFFKNSMVKNVALVDRDLQGKRYASNKGGSGFGKFLQLPQPIVIAWQSNKGFDFFAGSHDGFEDVGVSYFRQVIYLKDDFWIVKDNFSSSTAHSYQQVWQGHYTLESGPNLLRANSSDGCGHDIVQLINTDTVQSDGVRGKQWSTVSRLDKAASSFVTIIYPYCGYSNRVDETTEDLNIAGWKRADSEWKLEGFESTGLTSEKGTILLNISSAAKEDLKITSDTSVDLFVKESNGRLEIHSIGYQEQLVQFEQDGGAKSSKSLNPGEVWVLKIE